MSLSEKRHQCILKNVFRGVIRILLKGWQNGGLGDFRPQRGPGVETQWGFGSEAPKSQRFWSKISLKKYTQITPFYTITQCSVAEQ